jgi:exopolysaccharide biosynthesis protein
MKLLRRIFLLSIIVVWMQSIVSYPFVKAAQYKEQIKISQGVTLIKERKASSGKDYAFHVLDVHLSTPYTTVELGLPNPLTKLTTTSALAKQHTYSGHRVIGAINGSFFHVDSGEPAYLLAKDNKIINLGAVSYDSNDYMHTPAAFGISKDGKAIVDSFQLDIRLSHHGKTYKIDSFNKARDDNESILYTSSYRFPNTRTNPYGLEVVVSNVTKRIDGEAKFGEKIQGKVISIRPYGQKSSATIPKDGFVISAQGEKVEAIRQLSIGDQVELTIDLNSQWKDSKFMVASGPLLVQKGKVQMTIDESSPRAYERHPHSAVAIDQTGTRVLLVTVDGRKSGYSNGMTLKEFAQYIVQLGGYQAINLDGGGSTTMVARNPGKTFATIVNSPSDGRERAVSSILEVVNTAPLGEPSYLSAAQAQSGKIAVGGKVAYKLHYVLDQYYNPLSFSNDKITLEVIGNIGRAEGNVFVAEKPGSGYVIVKYGKAQQKLPVTVVSSPHQLSVEPKSLVIGKGKSQKITVKALDENGKPFNFGPEAVTWSVSGGVGKMDKNGVFTAGEREGSGSIKAVFGNKSVTIPVQVTDKPVVLDSFDSFANWKTENIRASSSISAVGKEEAQEGKGAVKLTYNFSLGKGGTAASYLVAKKPIHLSGKPDSIGLWVYGDGKGHWLRGKVRDGNGKEVTIDFTKEGGLDWHGWKYVQAKLPENIALPIRLEKMYVAEPAAAKQGKGVLYFDKVQAVYSSSHKEKYFESNANAKKVDKMKTWTVTFNMPLNPKTVTAKTVYVEDQFGNRQDISVQLDQTEKVVKVYAPGSAYKEGTFYRLVITKGVASKKGKALVKDYKTIFFVQ